jgi:2-polyprenyl-3-methyl-5-hydroxy-6-metoxy-1,4-benzoquinol methylase
MSNIKINCPLCNEQAYILFTKNSCEIFRCKLCAYEFTQIDKSLKHAHSVYGDDYFSGGNSGYSNYWENEELLIKSGEKYSKLIEKYIKTGEMLDVGAAAGFLLKGFTNNGWTGIGIEPNVKMTEYANNNLGLKVIKGTIEDFKSDKQYDLITMIQVISHFYDIKKALTKASKLTKNHGFWLIETWNKDSFSAKIFGNKWHEYNPPSVIRWFSKSMLTNYVSKFGLKLILSKHPIKWINSKQAKNIIAYNIGKTMSKHKVIAKAVNLIPDDLKFPYLADDLFWALYQKVN